MTVLKFSDKPIQQFDEYSQEDIYFYEIFPVEHGFFHTPENMNYPYIELPYGDYNKNPPDIQKILSNKTNANNLKKNGWNKITKPYEITYELFYKKIILDSEKRSVPREDYRSWYGEIRSSFWRRDYISIRWMTGGQEGGSCYNENPEYYSSEAEPEPTFDKLDSICSFKSEASFRYGL